MGSLNPQDWLWPCAKWVKWPYCNIMWLVLPQCQNSALIISFKVHVLCPWDDVYKELIYWWEQPWNWWLPGAMKVQYYTTVLPIAWATSRMIMSKGLKLYAVYSIIVWIADFLSDLQFMYRNSRRKHQVTLTFLFLVLPTPVIHWYSPFLWLSR